MTPLLNGTLLAQAGRAVDLGRNFRGSRARFDSGDLLILLLIFASAGLLIWGLSKLLAHQDRAKRCNHPGKLFRDLCRSHGLDRNSRGLLKELAQEQGLDDPSRLFLEPERFNPKNVGRPLQEQQMKIDELRSTLFAGG